MNQLNDTSVSKLVEKFLKIKALGFVPSRRMHNTGIGKTFEDLLEKEEDNLAEADFEGIEVKSQRDTALSYITLFTKSPSFPRGANRILRDNYGALVDQSNPLIKKLHTSIFGNRYNTYRDIYGFKLDVNRSQEGLYLSVKDLETNNVILDSIGWSFNDLQKAALKIKTLFVVWADQKIYNGVEHFHYTKAIIYHDFNIGHFITAMENGGIMVDIRIGTYKSGSNMGKPHDHGTGFRVKREFLDKLYDEREDVE